MANGMTDGKKERERLNAALRRIADAVVDAVREAGDFGAPESMIHIALQTQGATYDQCVHLVEALIAAGRLRREPGPLLKVAS